MAARTPSYNKNNSAVKRIMSEARELEADSSHEYSANPLEEDIFDWHCTIRGPQGTEFEGGLYHCRIVLPAEYPFKAPSIMLLTPNGRFELNKKICISFTSYHEDLWQPSWGVRTAIIGLQSFFPIKGEGAAGVGAIEVPINERKRLAALSRDWVCPQCEQSNVEHLPDPPTNHVHDESTEVEEAQVPSPSVPTTTETTIVAPQEPSQSPLVNIQSSTSPEMTSLPAISELSAPLTIVAAVPSPEEKVSQEISSSSGSQTIVPVTSSSSSSNRSGRTSHAIDLTPSTPAARIAVHNDDTHARRARSAPLAIDVAIVTLIALLFGLLARKFI